VQERGYGLGVLGPDVTGVPRGLDAAGSS